MIFKIKVNYFSIRKTASTKSFCCKFPKNFVLWMRTACLCCFLASAMTRFPVVSLLTLPCRSRIGTSTKSIFGRTGRRRRAPSCIFASVISTRSKRLNGLTSSSCISRDINTGVEEVEEQMQRLEQKFYVLNNHTGINLCSPRQVAKAIRCANATQSYLQSILVAPQHQYTAIQREMADAFIRWKCLQKRKMLLLQGGLRNISHQGIISTNYTSSDNSLSKVEKSRTAQEDETLQQTTSSNFSPLLPTEQNSHSNYQDFIEFLFSSEKCQVHEMWKNVLLHQVDKPSATNLVFQLKSDVCPMGYHYYNNNNKSSKSSASSSSTPLLDFVRQQKQKYPTSIILTRVGEFYEAIGLDAILLVQFCGLNPMGGKPKAGCPIQNIQQTLDGLTQHGFSIAVYEEATTAKKSSRNEGSSIAKKGNNSNNKLKRRIFAQQVTPANPTYMYDLCLGVDTLDVLSSQVEARPHVGIVHSAAAGYTMVEILWEERLVRISERLPAEAVSCRLSAYPPVDPLFYIPTLTDLERKKSSPTTSSSTLLPFLPSPDRTSSSGAIYASSNNNNSIRVQWLPQFLLSEEVPDVSEVERYKNVFVNELLRTSRSTTGNNEEEQTSESISAADFMLSLASSTSSYSNSITTMPLHKETATQLGLLGNPVIPNLVSYLLPPNSPAATRRFLKRWLLIPPPSHIATSMRKLIHYLMVEHNHPQPPMFVPQVGKVVSLIRAHQASSPVFRELIGILSTTISILNTYHAVDDVLALIEQESGIKAEKHSLQSRCSLSLQCIEQVVQPLHINHNIDKCSDYGFLIPKAFFERNEDEWRGRIRRDVAEQTYVNVERAAKALVETIQRDFWGNPNDTNAELRNPASSSSSIIAHDIFNNILSLKSVPRWASMGNNNKENYYYHPRDRNGKLLKDRWTTKDVETALSSYLQACQDACDDVRSTLTHLSETLCHGRHLPTIVQAAHANIIISTAYYHASLMSKKKWSLANVSGADISDSTVCALKFFDLWPYWMDEASAVCNSFEVRGLYILTSPNMAGKSTLMRSTAAAALLTACGLCAPLGKGSWIKPFDILFVRGASADVPSEGKSAFGAEMGDIATLLRCCGEHSLVFVDELARGTSPRDGTSLAGAILEEMALKGMSGFFATHLHGILSLPLNSDAAVRLGRRRMALNETKHDGSTFSYGWSYKIEEGVCTESLALNTAERFGLSENILKRAETFLQLVSEVEVGCSSSANQMEKNIYLTVDLKQNTSEMKEICEGLPAISRFLEGMADTKVFSIPRQHLPPAQLARAPCVYVLQLEDGSDHRYYVGQTTNLVNRIRQHRKKGSQWKASDAIAISVEKGTDEARIIESTTIRELSRLGYKLISWVDGV